MNKRMMLLSVVFGLSLSSICGAEVVKNLVAIDPTEASEFRVSVVKKPEVLQQEKEKFKRDIANFLGNFVRGFDPSCQWAQEDRVRTLGILKDILEIMMLMTHEQAIQLKNVLERTVNLYIDAMNEKQQAFFHQFLDLLHGFTRLFETFGPCDTDPTPYQQQLFDACSKEILDIMNGSASTKVIAQNIKAMI